jgi:hypothetical protein
MWGALELKLTNVKTKCDNLMGFGVDRLLIKLEKKNRR